MQFVLLLIFQIISGLVLLPIVIHYVYYIINAIAGDLCEQKRAQREQQLQKSPCPVEERHPRPPPPPPSLVINNLTNNSCRSAPLPLPLTTTATTMQTNDDAKFIKKCVCIRLERVCVCVRVRAYLFVFMCGCTSGRRRTKEIANTSEREPKFTLRSY